jgi:hypothetical protein
LSFAFKAASGRNLTGSIKVKSSQALVPAKQLPAVLVRLRGESVRIPSLLQSLFLLAISTIVEYSDPGAEGINTIVFDRGVFHESPLV